MDPRKLLERAGLEAKGVPQSLYGGDISRVYRLGAYVVKLAPNPPLGLFPAEARGLKALAERGVRVPRVFFASEEGLILEYLPEGPPDWEGLARMLAGLHRQREGQTLPIRWSFRQIFQDQSLFRCKDCPLYTT
ncbi:fructosamine kinase family protein, partial [Thermus scotoductus]|uniref:fructosamine kinase family protein n=1 Tax=Thermus scotoductus TaxID=37636 RepID=UPI0020A25D64